MADRWGGARVTFWNFLAMIGAAAGVVLFIGLHRFDGFLAMFLLLFATSGIGNASTFRMIPTIFSELGRRRAERGEASSSEAHRQGTMEAGAILGFSSAVGAFGGFIIPIVFGGAIRAGAPETALAAFMGFYASCIVLTWWFYFRPHAEAPC